MNLATAIRELRKMSKIGLFDEGYQKYKEFLKLPGTESIKDEKLKKIIISHYTEKNEKYLLNFIMGLPENLIDLTRYEKYKELRKINKFDSSSEEFFKIKYGNSWKEYYDRAKLERINMYSVSDYVNKHGMLIEEARELVNDRKQKTTPSLEKYIQKYGNQLGKEKFKKTYRRHKNYLDYWLKVSNGNKDSAEKLFRDYTRRANNRCIEFYISRGYSEDEAIKLISEYQKNNSGVHKEYYKNRGYSEEEINCIMQAINRKKDSASLNFIKMKYPEVDLYSFYREFNKTKSSRYRESGYLAKDDPKNDERERYYLEVHYYTRQSKIKIVPCPGITGRTSGTYHIDHIYSIDEGFKNGIDSKIIGSPVNLRWLLAEVNSSKKQKSDISKEELIREYNNYENKKNNQTQP